MQADPQTLAHDLAGSKKLYNFFDSVFAIGKSAIDRIIADYRLASTPDQAIIFLQLYTAGQCRTGKIMQYNPSTGKRIKDETIPGRINWLHTTLKRRKIIVFPGIDAFKDWQQKIFTFPHLDLKVSDRLEKNATPEARTAHIDLAYWLIQYLLEAK